MLLAKPRGPDRQAPMDAAARTPTALSENQLVHRDVVGFWKRVLDDLVWKTNANFQDPGPGFGKHPVIESAAAAETPAARVERKSGAEKRIDSADRLRRQ